MLDAHVSERIVALRDVGVSPQQHERLAERCRVALDREIARERGRRPHRIAPRRGTAGVFAAIVLGLLGGVGYAALSSPAELSAGIECHVDSTVGGSGTIVRINGQPAAVICARVWARGEVKDGLHSPPAPLHTCVDPNGGGAIHVFASADPKICAQRGLREDPAAGTGLAAKQYVHFSNILLRWLDAASCPSLARVRDKVDSALGIAGLRNWQVVARGLFNAQTPCASVAISSDARTVSIVPIGP